MSCISEKLLTALKKIAVHNFVQAKPKCQSLQPGMNPVNAPAFENDAMVATPDNLFLGELKTRVVEKDIAKHIERLEKAR